jgi:outer membrane protein assembly factor BamE (lipoprotein component of BamABCDE complex)
MRAMTFAAAVVLSTLVLSACGGSRGGTKVSAEQLSQFHDGQTTYKEVVSALGPPDQTTTTSDGNKTISYTFVGVKIQPQTFVPFVGPMIGGTNSETSTAILVFDRNDVLVRSSASHSATTYKPQ